MVPAFEACSLTQCYLERAGVRGRAESFSQTELTAFEQPIASTGDSEFLTNSAEGTCQKLWCIDNYCCYVSL